MKSVLMTFEHNRPSFPFFLKAAGARFTFTFVLCLVFPLVWKSCACSPDLLESRALEQLTIPQNDYDLCCPGKRQLCNCPVIPWKWKDTITQLAFWRVRIRASCERNQMKWLFHPPFSSEVVEIKMAAFVIRRQSTDFLLFNPFLSQPFSSIRCNIF